MVGSQYTVIWRKMRSELNILGYVTHSSGDRLTTPLTLNDRTFSVSTIPRPGPELTPETWYEKGGSV